MHNIVLPPHDIQMEKQFLSCFLLDPNLIWQTIVAPDDLYDGEHRKLLETMIRLYKEKITIDCITLISSGIDQDMAFELSTYALTTSWFKSYEDIIRSKAIYRELIKKAQLIVSKAYDEWDLADIMSGVRKMSDLTNINRTAWVSYYDSIVDCVAGLGKEEDIICKYWYKSMDKVFKGMKKTQLVVMWARPWVGKTMLAINICDNVVKQWKRVALFSLEMSEHEISERILSRWTWKNIWSQRLEDIDFDAMEKCVTKNIKDQRWLMIYTGVSLFGEIVSNIRKAVIQDWVEVVVIDYLQLMRLRWSSRMSTNDKIGTMTSELKAIAQELGIAILLLSQLNRQWKDQPTIAHLRDSWNIEQDANIVMLLYRDSDDEDYDNLVKVIVAKHRNWKTAQIFLGVDASTMNIFDVDNQKYAHLI